MKYSIRSVLLVCMAISMSACPNPFERPVLEQLQDQEAPVITLVSPGEYGEYGTVLLLQGTVSDNGEVGSAAVSRLEKELYFAVAGTIIGGTIALNADGSFSGIIDMSGIDGQKLLSVTAWDRNGNEAVVSVNVIKPSDGGNVSGFMVIPGNKQVTISWDPVPEAESYTISELSYGTSRAMGSGTSYLWTGLENGEEYLFKITAHIPDTVGEDAESSVVSVFPLSGRSLMPWIDESIYGEISLSWVDYPMIDRYTVQRGTSSSGPWATVRTTLSNHYIDSSVSPGQSFYYRVAPASSDVIQSSPVSAAPVSFSSGSAMVVMPGDVLATEAAGDYLYSLCAHKPGSYIEGILVVTDISSPSNPRIVKEIDLGRTPFDLCLSGNMLWIAMGFNGILGFNISIPDAPFLAADLDTNSAAGDVGLALCAAGSYVYLADGSEGVKIIDVSTPSSPQVKSTWTTDIEVATDIVLSGDYLYVGVNNDHQWGSFTRIDISDPLNPSGTFSPLGWECLDTEQFPQPRIDAEGGTVYLATWAHYGVFINDGTVPAYTGPPGEFVNVEAVGTDLYLMPAGDYGMYADATNPFDVSPGSHDFFNTVLTPADMDINGTLYIASTHNPIPAQHSGSIIISDFNTPAGASLAATIETGDDFPYAVDASGDDLYVLFSDGVINTKLGRYDGGTSSPGTGDFSETFDVTGMGGAEPREFDLAVSGGYAFAADGKNRLSVVDISDPGSLGVPKHTQTPHTIFALEIAGPYAYCAGRGLSVLDISDPENADVIYIDSFDSGDITGAWIYDMDRIGNTLYLSGEGRVYSVDISDPENPGTITLADDFSMADSSTIALYEDGFYLILDDGSSNYRLDVWHPDAGGTYETVNGISHPTAIAASGDYALLGTKTGGLAVADISAFDGDPPVTIISAGDGRFVADAVVTGGYAYAVGFDDDESGDTDGAVWIIDLDG